MKLLIVDDDVEHLQMLELFTRKLGYDVLRAEDGRIAWELWQREKPRIVVTDWLMPHISGLDLCRKIRSCTDQKHYTYLIVISGQNTQQDIVQGLETGIDDYMVKPVSLGEYRARLKNGIRIVTLETELIHRYEDIKRNYLETIRMFNNLIEVFDGELGGHSRRVAQLSLKMARRSQDFTEEDFQILETAALLHDIGMIGLPIQLLSKSRIEMTGNENELYRSHPILGEIILKEIELLKPVARLVRAHHEQYNGRGFPDGLSREQIPLAARIISAASIYDNIVHKGDISLNEVPAKLHQMKGYQIDPFFIDLLLEINLEAIEEEAKKTALEIPIDDLKEGMVLAGDVRRKNGALILPANTEISRYGIEKLKKHCELACISDKVFIQKESVIG